MINNSFKKDGFLFNIEVSDLEEQRSVTYKGPVYSLSATINENLDCFIITEDLLSVLKKDRMLDIKVSILEKTPV